MSLWDDYDALADYDLEAHLRALCPEDYSAGKTDYRKHSSRLTSDQVAARVASLYGG